MSLAAFSEANSPTIVTKIHLGIILRLLYDRCVTDEQINVTEVIVFCYV